MSKELDVTNTTRANISEYREVIEAMYPLAAADIQAAGRIGELALLDGKKVLIIGPKTVADISFAPDEAYIEGAAAEGFVTHDVPVGLLELVTHRTAAERMMAMVEFANTYSTKYGVMHNFVIMMTGSGEDVFEGFSEGATMNDVAVYYGDKLNFTEDQADKIVFEEFHGHRYGFDVRELKVVKKARHPTEAALN